MPPLLHILRLPASVRRVDVSLSLHLAHHRMIRQKSLSGISTQIMEKDVCASTFLYICHPLVFFLHVFAFIINIILGGWPTATHDRPYVRYIWPVLQGARPPVFTLSIGEYEGDRRHPRGRRHDESLPICVAIPGTPPVYGYEFRGTRTASTSTLQPAG